MPYKDRYKRIIITCILLVSGVMRSAVRTILNHTCAAALAWTKTGKNHNNVYFRVILRVHAFGVSYNILLKMPNHYI